MTLTFASVVAYVIGVLNAVVLVLGSVALVLFLWGGFQYIYKAGAKDKRQTLLWSFIALFILFSIWGILGLLCVSFLGTKACGSASYSGGGPGVESIPASKFYIQ